MAGSVIVGIAGGTGSGKTTVAKALTRRLKGKVQVISHDNYYRAHHGMSDAERARLNYDHPDAYETELLVAHLSSLRRGAAIEMPIYDFAIHDRVEATTHVEPTPIILVEGILVLADERLRDLMDLKIFVDADADVRILRRAQRDALERARSLESVMEQYLTTVKPMHEAFVEPSKRHANLIIPSNGSNVAGENALLAGILALL